jgi:hypothetical protein
MTDPLPPTCPECGAPWTDGVTCTADFHQMLFWENQRPELGAVHHLMVLSFNLQHPSVYLLEMLASARQMLADFLEGRLTPQEFRRQNKQRLSSTERTWKITGTPEFHGSYDPPIHWTMTARDVVSGGIDHYIENVNRWSSSILEQFPKATPDI